jgi:hypothetical protein
MRFFILFICLFVLSSAPAAPVPETDKLIRKMLDDVHAARPFDKATKGQLRILMKVEFQKPPTDLDTRYRQQSLLSFATLATVHDPELVKQIDLKEYWNAFLKTDHPIEVSNLEIRILNHARTSLMPKSFLPYVERYFSYVQGLMNKPALQRFLVWRCSFYSDIRALAKTEACWKETDPLIKNSEIEEEYLQDKARHYAQGFDFIAHAKLVAMAESRAKDADTKAKLQLAKARNLIGQKKPQEAKAIFDQVQGLNIKDPIFVLSRDLLRQELQVANGKLDGIQAGMNAIPPPKDPMVEEKANYRARTAAIWFATKDYEKAFLALGNPNQRTYESYMLSTIDQLAYLTLAILLKKKPDEAVIRFMSDISKLEKDSKSDDKVLHGFIQAGQILAKSTASMGPHKAEFNKVLNELSKTNANQTLAYKAMLTLANDASVK